MSLAVVSKRHLLYLFFRRGRKKSASVCHRFVSVTSDLSRRSLVVIGSNAVVVVVVVAVVVAVHVFDVVAVVDVVMSLLS